MRAYNLQFVLLLAVLSIGCGKGSSELSREEALRIVKDSAIGIQSFQDLIAPVKLCDVSFKGEYETQRTQWQQTMEALDELARIGIVTKKPLTYYAQGGAGWVTEPEPPEVVASTLYHYEIVPSADARQSDYRGDQNGCSAKEAGHVTVARNRPKEVTGIRASDGRATVHLKSELQKTETYLQISKLSGDLLIRPAALGPQRTDHECQFGLYDDGWRLEECDGYRPVPPPPASHQK